MYHTRMITDWADANIVASVNTWTGYPAKCDVTDETFNRMVKLISFVANSPYPVMPNSAFWNMRDLVGRGLFNCRGAFAFRFWFDDLETADLFHRAYGGALEVPPVLPG